MRKMAVVRRGILEEFHREGAVSYKEAADVIEGKPNRRISHFLLLPNRHSQQTVVVEKVWCQPRQWRCNVGQRFLVGIHEIDG